MQIGQKGCGIPRNRASGAQVSRSRPGIVQVRVKKEPWPLFAHAGRTMVATGADGADAVCADACEGKRRSGAATFSACQAN